MPHTRDMTTTRELAAAHLATKTNEELLEMSALLEGKQDEAGRAVRAAVSDAITDRFDIWEILDRIYDEDFEGTYHDAMVLSIAEKAARA